MANKEIVEKIDELSNELENLVYSEEVITTLYAKWNRKALRYLKSIFGDESEQIMNYTNISFTCSSYDMDCKNDERFDSAKKEMIALFESFLEEIEDDSFKFCKKESKEMDKSKVFIVHGHDDKLKEEVARFITELELEPIILHEQANAGKTIIEKIEKYSNVGYGIVLYTDCDEGAKKGEKSRPRARQNVVFEHGYLIAKLGRKRVSAIFSHGIEMPNDISGIIYIKQNDWKMDIAKELKHAGFNIDLNKVIS